MNDDLLVGVVFPHAAFAAGTDGLADYVGALEGAGIDYLTVFDHVAGAPAEAMPQLPAVPYDHRDPFLESLVLLSYVAACTTTIELSLGVLILPQRQTVLAAKQLATIDLLSGERVRLGLGVGWNPVEFGSLGAPFHRRGDVLDEQVALLGELWDGGLVTSSSEHHRWGPVAIAPAPRRRIPLWFGGSSERMLQRVVRWGDGWVPARMDARTGGAVDVAGAVERLGAELDRAGRSRASVGLEGRVAWAGDRSATATDAQAWRDLGADRVAIVVDDRLGATPEAHLEATLEASAVLRGVGP